MDPRNLYERVYLTVPMIGAGTYADPKRPMFAPKPSEMKPGDRTGIIAWHFEASDDGKTALVEYVFANRTTQSTVMSAISALPSVQIFQKGKDAPANVQAVFQTLKKDFDLSRFTVVVP